MGKAVLHDSIYLATELVHEGTCVFFVVESPVAFFSTITG
jgi:hypothetical protein